MSFVEIRAKILLSKKEFWNAETNELLETLFWKSSTDKNKYLMDLGSINDSPV